MVSTGLEPRRTGPKAHTLNPCTTEFPLNLQIMFSPCWTTTNPQEHTYIRDSAWELGKLGSYSAL